jgi:hypothetical protein
MPKKTLKQKKSQKKRGGGPETEIQKNIREELERILEIFTLCPDVRIRYTQNSIFDYTSDGAKLIGALRDLYSSKAVKGSIKAEVRNELIVRIIKLIINEFKFEQEQGYGNPVQEGLGYKVRVPIKPINPEVISLLTLSLPSFLLNKVVQCVGAVCNTVRTISDNDAFENLRAITQNIANTNTKITQKFDLIKEWFDRKENIIAVADSIAETLINEMLNYNYISKNINPNLYILGLKKSIKKLNLLFFISNFFYENLLYNHPNTVLEFNDVYINKLFDILMRHIPYINANAEYIPITAYSVSNDSTTNSTDSTLVPVAVKVPGGKNTHRRKSHRKTHKKQNQKTI